MIRGEKQPSLLEQRCTGAVPETFCSYDKMEAFTLSDALLGALTGLAVSLPSTLQDPKARSISKLSHTSTYPVGEEIIFPLPTAPSWFGHLAYRASLPTTSLQHATTSPRSGLSNPPRRRAPSSQISRTPRGSRGEHSSYSAQTILRQNVIAIVILHLVADGYGLEPRDVLHKLATCKRQMIVD